MYTNEAIEQASEAGLNLVEVSPNADPPVCKFLDVGKYRYEAQKKANAARKTQKTQDIKEIKMRPNIDDHDYDVKMRNVNKFIDNGDKVKVTLRFRGREMAHQQLGMDLLKRVQDDVAEIAKVEAYPAPRRPPDADGAGAEIGCALTIYRERRASLVRLFCCCYSAGRKAVSGWRKSPPRQKPRATLPARFHHRWRYSWQGRWFFRPLFPHTGWLAPP